MCALLWAARVVRARIHAVHAHRMRGTAGSRPKRQGDPRALSASGHRADMNQAGGLAADNAVATMCHVTGMAHLTPMGDVTAVDHVPGVSGEAAETAAVITATAVTTASATAPSGAAAVPSASAAAR